MTDEIDRVVHETITKGGGYPSPLNYHCFPKSVCTSVNEVICHGIPDARPLENVRSRTFLIAFEIYRRACHSVRIANPHHRCASILYFMSFRT